MTRDEVLVADDDRLGRWGLVEPLREWRYEVLEAENVAVRILTMAACCLVLFAYVLFVQSASSLNWFVLILLAAACPLMHLITHRGGRHH